MVEIPLLAGERQSGESDNAVLACNDWLRLGPGRSLPALAEKYNEGQQKSAPTQSLATLQKWSSKNDWAERAVEFDANWDAIRNREREQELAYGLALDYERVRKLKRLADFLEAQIYEQGEPDPSTGKRPYHNVWCPDVKVVGHGDSAEVVDIERFNGALFTQYRETLNDLAKEVGGRVQRSSAEVSGPGGGAVEVRVISIVKMDMDEL